MDVQADLSLCCSHAIVRFSCFNAQLLLQVLIMPVGSFGRAQIAPGKKGENVNHDCRLLYFGLNSIYGHISYHIWLHQQISSYKLPYLDREGSGSVVECLTRDRGFEPHRCHCVVVLEHDTFILA